MQKSKARSRFIVLCVAPAVVLFFIFMVLPTLNVFRMSLFERGAYSPTETFVGLNNFKILFQDAKFISAIQNTILLIVTVTLITFFFAILFAAILTREKIKGQNFFRVIFYIPNILSVVVIAGIFSAIYKPENGMLNSILSFAAGRDVMVLWKDQPMVIVSVIIAMVWQAIGYYMVMYMASMAAVPGDRRRARRPVLPDHPAPHLDQHPHYFDLLHHLHHQYGVPVRQGHGGQGYGRCGIELYVHPEGRGPVWLRHGGGRGDLPLLLPALGHGQQGHKAGYPGNVRRAET